jgi:hypothetical protein
MNQIHPSVEGFVGAKQHLAKMERSQDEFVELKRQQTAPEKADLYAVSPSSPKSSSSVAAKPLAVAESGSGSKMCLESLVPLGAPKPSSAGATSRKRPSLLACELARPSLEKQSQFVLWLALPKPSSGVETSLKNLLTEAFGLDPCAVAAMPVLSDHWTLTHVCCIGLACGNSDWPSRNHCLSLALHQQGLMLLRR